MHIRVRVRTCIHPLPLDTGVAIAAAFCPLKSAAINQSKEFAVDVCDIGIIFIIHYLYTQCLSACVLSYNHESYKDILEAHHLYIVNS